MKLLHVLIGFLALTSVAFAATQQPTLSGKPLTKAQDLATAGPRILKKRGLKKVVKKVAKTAIKSYLTYSTPGGAYYARIQKAQEMAKKARAVKAQIKRVQELNRMRKTQGWKAAAKSQLKVYAKTRFQNSAMNQRFQGRLQVHKSRATGFRNNQQAKLNVYVSRLNVKAQGGNVIRRKYGGWESLPPQYRRPALKTKIVKKMGGPGSLPPQYRRPAASKMILLSGRDAPQYRRPALKTKFVKKMGGPGSLPPQFRRPAANKMIVKVGGRDTLPPSSHDENQKAEENQENQDSDSEDQKADEDSESKEGKDEDQANPQEQEAAAESPDESSPETEQH